MSLTDEHQFPFLASGISLIMHAVVVGLALAFIVLAKPVLHEDMFQWDVALVDAKTCYCQPRIW